MTQAGQTIIDPEPPLEFAYILEWAWKLISRCSSNGFSRNPVSYTDLDAWARLTGTAPEPWEIEILLSLDTAALDESVKSRK